MTTIPSHNNLPRLPEGPSDLLLAAGGIADGTGRDEAPASLLIEISPLQAAQDALPEGCRRAVARVLAAGPPGEVACHPRAAAAIQGDFSESVLIPGLVNAHAHLDLTHVGPMALDPDRGFSGWIDGVRRARATVTAAIAESVRRGVHLMLAGGVVAVGDIAGAPGGVPSLEPGRVLRGSALGGVSFLEYFGIGHGEDRGIEAVERALEAATQSGGAGARLGLQPHAPNTVSPRGYEWACDRARDLGVPLATHLAETIEEREFVATGRGPQRELLESLGLWNDRASEAVGYGHSPVRHLRSVLERSRFVLAHLNDASDEDLSILAGTGQSVAYCPRASEYFGNPTRLGPHRYREMLARGINVTLGTDSIINLPRGTGGPGSEWISVLDEMQRLHERDGTEPATLLRMGTINGARALGLNESGFVFDEGAALAGLVAVDLRQAGGAPWSAASALLRRGSFPRPLFVGNSL